MRLSTWGVSEMKEDLFRRFFVPVLCAGILAFGPAQAEESSTSNGWDYALGIYLWGADISGNTASGTKVDVSFKDLFDSLNAGFMGAFQARKDKWLVITDLIYLDVSNDTTAKVSIPIGPIAIDVKADVDVDLKGKVFHLAGGYNLFSKGRSSLDLYGGARYLDLDMDAKIKLSAGQIQSRPIKISESDHVWDGIVGVKGSYALGQRWAIPYLVDIGTGQSDFTWQAKAGVTFNATKSLDVDLLYRYIHWDVGGDIIDDITFKGPVLGAVFRF